MSSGAVDRPVTFGISQSSVRYSSAGAVQWVLGSVQRMVAIVGEFVVHVFEACHSTIVLGWGRLLALARIAAAGWWCREAEQDGQVLLAGVCMADGVGVGGNRL